MLLIDEVDSFLRSRERAVHTWEISAVNEMLVQMENFQGIFFATTNLKEQLDAASLRRFDLKLSFDYLRLEQSRALLQELASCLQLHVEDVAKAALPSDLTPGDFANVFRQASLRQVNTVARAVELLAEEAAARAPNRRQVGFLVAA